MNDDKLIETGTKPNKVKQELNRNIHETHTWWRPSWHVKKFESSLICVFIPLLWCIMGLENTKYGGQWVEFGILWCLYSGFSRIIGGIKLVWFVVTFMYLERCWYFILFFIMLYDFWMMVAMCINSHPEKWPASLWLVFWSILMLNVCMHFNVFLFI